MVHVKKAKHGAGSRHFNEFVAQCSIAADGIHERHESTITMKH